MNIEKSSWQVDKNRIRLSVPFSKVDAERRLVSGFATLDNVDQQGDVVHADASVRAFSNFRGNIREMHQPIAAGRMVDFREDSFYDPTTQKMFNGIFVTVYVSKGAESTWEKVLDGTLSGFSIGGNIIDDSTEYVPDLGKTVRFVKEYELIELSLVDNPANQLANVFSVEKAADGSLVFKGMAVDTEIVNVFWCANDKVARTTKSESLDCGTCGSKMESIGWFESTEDTTTKVQEVVNNFLQKASVTEEFASETNVLDNTEEGTETSVTEEGGVNVPEERVEAEVEATLEKAAEVEEAAVDAADESAETTETVEESSSDEEAAEVSEVAEVPDFEKMFADLKKSITDGFEENKSEVEKRLEEVASTFDSKLSELAEKHDALTEKFNALKTNVDDVEKALSTRVEGVEKSTAVKKSGDLGGSTEAEVTKTSKSNWGGHFFAVSDL